MKPDRLSLFLLISVGFCLAVAHAQSDEAGSANRATASGSVGITRAPESSWEAWINHAARDGLAESQVPPRSPDLGRVTQPLTPSIGPRSGLFGPESGRGPSRLRSNTESEVGSGTTADRTRR